MQREQLEFELRAYLFIYINKYALNSTQIHVAVFANIR